jgi:hypothetical protein
LGKVVAAYTYCISSHNATIVLSYQWLPTSIKCGEAIARRRKSDGRVGSASRGMVRQLDRFFSPGRPRVSQIARGGLIGAPPRGVAIDVCSDAPARAQRADRVADGGVVDVS